MRLGFLETYFENKSCMQEAYWGDLLRKYTYKEERKIELGRGRSQSTMHVQLRL